MSTTNNPPPKSPRKYRRTSDITPASRVVSSTQSAPTSPKIHELRERYESAEDKEKDERHSRRSTAFSDFVAHSASVVN
jgi:hypothetical protein